MFGFLNSTFLFAAAAALIPLIIHLFSRRRVKVIEFSSLKHLKAMQRRQVRRLKIRQLLLLLIRMLIILALVIAFARPTLREGSVGSHAAVSAVILLDNSASMSRYVADGILFDQALTRTTELLNTFGESDRVCLITLDRSTRQPETAEFVSAVVAAGQLTQAIAGSGKADFDITIETALELLDNAPSLNRELFIVSDKQRSTLPYQVKINDDKIKLYFVDLPAEPVNNIGITSLNFGGQLILPGHDFEITARIKNYGATEANDLLVSLFIDNNRVAQSDLSLTPGAETDIRFERAVSSTGFHSGYIELSEDIFSGDNRYYFSFSIPRQSNILVVKNSTAAPLITLALTPSPEINQYWSVKEITTDQLAGVNFLQYDVVVLSGSTNLNEVYTRRLLAYVQSGKSLFVTYDSAGANYFNSAWAGATGVTIEQDMRVDITKSGYYSLQSIDIEHPIFSVFNFESNQLPAIKFYTLPNISIGPDARTLMTLSGDRPALVENRFGQGRILTLAGPISPAYSDLTGHAFFVPFLSRIVEYLASDLSSFDVQLFVGDNITRTVSLAGTLRASLKLTTPDSAAHFLVPIEEYSNLLLRVKPVALPGIYQISYAGAQTDRFAVNIRPEECNLTVASIDEFARRLGTEDFVQIAFDDPVDHAVAELRFGRELWRHFLWLAALLLAAEMIISRGFKAQEASS